MNNALKEKIKELDYDLKKWNDKYYDYLPSDVLKLWRDYYFICQKIIPLIDREKETDDLLEICFYSLLREKQAIHLMAILLDLNESEVLSKTKNHAYTNEEMKLFLSAWRN